MTSEHIIIYIFGLCTTLSPSHTFNGLGGYFPTVLFKEGIALKIHVIFCPAVANHCYSQSIIIGTGTNIIERQLISHTKLTIDKQLGFVAQITKHGKKNQ